jgi:hypothetical protein
MKKSLAISFFLFLTSMTGWCQLQIAVKGGYNYLWHYFIGKEDSHEQTSVTPEQNSFSIGFLIKDQTQKTFNPGLELEYRTRSFRVVNHYYGLGGFFDYDMDYQTGWINLYAKPCFSWGSKWKFLLNTGIYVGFMINSQMDAQRSGQVGGVFHDTTFSGNTRKYLEKTDLGIMAGVGLEIPLAGKFRILVENNYTLGILNLSESGNNGNLNNFITAEFTAGLAYRIEKGNLIGAKK